MKIINKTHYLTKDLRAILSRVAQEELETPKRKRLRVEVRYTRGHGCSGFAWIGGASCVVRISKHHPEPDAFAKVAAHEYAHLRGMSHVNMPPRYKWGSPTWRERYAWANALGIHRKPKIVKARPSSNDKLSHAQRSLARALTRQKRATTIAAKWKAKVRYYERQMAACAPVGNQLPNPEP